MAEDFDVAIGAAPPPQFTHQDRERIERLERRLAEFLQATATMPDECQRRHCSYFTEYLAKGPPTLAHEGYHNACRLRDGRLRAIIAYLREATGGDEYDTVVMYQRLRHNYQQIIRDEELIRFDNASVTTPACF